jgi:hypothetical protein
VTFGANLWQRCRDGSLFLFKATTHSLINKQTVRFQDKDSVI